MKNKSSKIQLLKNNINKNQSYNASIIIMLAVGIFIFFLPLLKAGFLNWDDYTYITDNEVIKAFKMENIESIFTKSFLSTYLPATMFSYMVDFWIGGLNPEVFHLTNLLLHIFNSLLVFILAKSIFDQTRPKSSSAIYSLKFVAPAIVSLLFAINPLQIESVAWLAERKNVLFAFFSLLSTIFYIKYINHDNLKYYILKLIAFIISCLSKGTAVSFSLTLICIDYLYDRKLLSKRIVIEKIPFFLLSIFFGIIAIAMQRQSAALQVGDNYSFFKAVLYAGYGFSMYFFKLLIPINISAYYPYPSSISIIFWFTLTTSLLIACSIVFLVIKQKKVLVFSLLFFLVNVIFLLQLIPVGKMLMADRYIYLSSIGLFLIIGHTYNLCTESINKNILNGVFIVYICFIAIAGFDRQKAWKDSIAMWNDVISKYPEVDVAWNNRAQAKEKINDIKGAINDYEYFINNFPKSEHVYNNLGNCKFHNGDFQGAIADFNMSLKLKPDYFVALTNRGLVYLAKKDYKLAMEDFENALKTEKYFVAYYSRATARYEIKDYKGAIEDFEEALKQKPDLIDFQLPDSYFKLGNIKKAIEYYVYLNRINPNADNYQRQAFTYYSVGDYFNAVLAYGNAIQLQPQNPDIYTNRGCTKMTMNNYPGAIDDFNNAIRLNAKDVKALYNRGISKITLGMKTEGCSDLNTVAALGYSWAIKTINKNCR